MVYAGFEAGSMQELKYKICWTKIVYQEIEAGKKYCLCKDWSQQERLSMQMFKDHLRIAWAGKQIQYSSHFFQNDSSKQNECSASISVRIIWFEQLQQGSYEKFNPGIFL